MKIARESLPFLTGETYHQSHIFSLLPQPSDKQYLGRLDFLLQKAAGLKVLHLGFLDHTIEVVRSKMADGKWLHARLLETCTRVAGIDINADGVKAAQDALDIPDLYVADVTRSLPDAISSEHWDMMLIGDVIEHIPNPAQFLSGLRETCGGKCDRFVFSTPNAMSHQEGSRSSERINSDHRYLFTPYTLSKILTEAGFTVTDVEFCKAGRVSGSKLMENWAMSRNPIRRSCLVVTAE